MFDWILNTPFPIETQCRDGYSTAAASKMERFVIIVNAWKPLTIITKHSILDVAAVLDPLLQWKVKKVLYDGELSLNNAMSDDLIKCKFYYCLSLFKTTELCVCI